MLIRADKVFVRDRFVTEPLAVLGDRIVDASALPAQDDVLDLSGYWLLPGWTDLHFHGALAKDLCDLDPTALPEIARYEASVGVTQICPATMTLPDQDLCALFARVGEYESQGDGADLVGVHMEGPYLSPNKLGAQNPAFVAQASVERFRAYQALAAGRIKIVSIAPEEPGALDFIAALHDEVVCSIAHCTADYALSAEAYRLGACHATHLFNAMPPLHHREPGVIGAAFDDPKVHVEVIADGIHLHPAIVRMIFQLFPGRVVLISDSMRACGLGEGRYDLGGQMVEVKGRTARIANGSIAGSVTNLADCVRFCLSEGLPVEAVLEAASTTPARVLGIDAEVGVLEPGRRANFQIWDPKTYSLKGVYLHGQAWIPFQEK